jgi:acyl carrier protein
VTAADVRESVERVVTDAVVEFGFDRSEVSLDASLADLDVSSLDVVELIQIAREEFGVEIQGQDIAACATLGDVVTLIADAASAEGTAPDGAATEATPAAGHG